MLGHDTHIHGVIQDNLPPELRQVWRWWCHLHEVRDWSRLTEPMTTPQGRLGWQVRSTAIRVAPERIEAWCRQRGIDLEQWHIAALELIDEFYCRIKNDPPAPVVLATKENLLAMFKALGAAAKRKK